MRAAASAMECIGYGGGAAIGITLLCKVPFLSIIHQTEQARRGESAQCLQITVNNCLPPLVPLYASSENNGLWPGLYKHSVESRKVIPIHLPGSLAKSYWPTAPIALSMLS